MNEHGDPLRHGREIKTGAESEKKKRMSIGGGVKQCWGVEKTGGKSWGAT